MAPGPHNYGMGIGAEYVHFTDEGKPQNAVSAHLVLLPKRQLRLLLLQLLRAVHHEVNDVNTARQRQQHQYVRQDAETDQNRSEKAGKGWIDKLGVTLFKHVHYIDMWDKVIYYHYRTGDSSE